MSLQSSAKLFEGKTVYHRARPEWGLGYVQSKSAESLWIVFENHGVEALKFSRRIVHKLLDVVPKDDVPQESPMRTKERRKALVRERRAEHSREERLAKARAKQKRRRRRTPLRGPVGVFTRNHEALMSEAAALCTQDPDCEVMFRSNRVWSTPKSWLHRGAKPKVFTAVLDGDGLIAFEGELVDVSVHPKDDDPLLEKSVPSAREEGLWDGDVKTLYVLKNVRRVEESYPMTELLKMRGDKPISAKYTRSYCLVRGRARDVIVGEDESP